YRVQVSPDDEFHAISADAVTTQPVADIADLPDGDYWLRVRAIDGFGIEGRDAVGRFTQHVLPEPPLPVAPTASTPVTGTHARFEWAGAGSGARYALQVARDSKFSLPMIERKPLDAAFVELDDMQPGLYFWRVASVNARGEAGPWSATESYAQRATVPTPVVHIPLWVKIAAPLTLLLPLLL
ncbi:MAG TPA: hypothetical protein VIJ37_03520, partial [Steroidobacteraceae bacterium]